MVRLPLLFEILGKMYIAIFCFPIFDVINFEINLICLIKLFLHMAIQENYLIILRMKKALFKLK